MGKFGKEPIESMQRAARHAAGKKVRGLRGSKVELPDVKASRRAAMRRDYRMAPDNPSQGINRRGDADSVGLPTPAGSQNTD
jgi:hypothetical protein